MGSFCSGENSKEVDENDAENGSEENIDGGNPDGVCDRCQRRKSREGKQHCHSCEKQMKWGHPSRVMERLKDEQV